MPPRLRPFRSLRSPLDAFAALAAVVSGLRSGVTLPGAASPLSGAPRDGGVPAARPRRGLRRSLFFGVQEGMTAEIVAACSGGAVLTAWALHLGGGPLLVGVLGALPYLSQFVQLPSAWVTSRLGGRKVALWTVAASRQVLWPLVFLPFAPWPQATKAGVLLAVTAVSSVLSIVGNNGWTTWMGDLVPRALRGRYFGRRTAICTLAGAFANLGAGLVLDVARRHDEEHLALALLALAAVAAGALSTVLMARQHDPGHVRQTEFVLADLVRPLQDGRARRLLVFLVPWNLGVGLSSTFFVVFMLQDLRMGFTLMALQSILSAAVRMLAAPLWGRAIDRVGARPVLVASSFLIIGIPLLWLWPTPDRLWPVFADSVASGLLWSGHNLATFQMPLTLAPREKRSFHLATFSAAGGLAFALAATFGGWAAGRLPAHVAWGPFVLARLQVLFVASAGIRLFAAFLALRTAEPGSRTVGELGRLVTAGAPRWVPRPAPAAAEPPASRRAG